MEVASVTKVVNEGWVSSQGPYCKQFEDDFSKFIGAEYSLATANCTVSIEAALRALDIGPGDEVILPNLTFISPANMVLSVGATPIFADIDNSSWTISTKSVQELISNKTKAIIAVHVYNDACDMRTLQEICDSHNLFLIEDVAESIGSKFEDKYLGTFGHFGCFSFFANKTITTGEGGCLITNNNELYRRAALIRDHGMTKEERYIHKVHGSNFRMTSMQAALGITQLQRFTSISEAKLSAAALFKQAMGALSQLSFKEPKNTSDSVPWLHTISLNDASIRPSLIEFMLKKGIELRPMVPTVTRALHFGDVRSRYPTPVADDVSERSIHLPSSPMLTNEQVLEIAQYIAEFFNE